MTRMSSTRMHVHSPLPLPDEEEDDNAHASRWVQVLRRKAHPATTGSVCPRSWPARLLGRRTTAAEVRKRARPGALVIQSHATTAALTHYPAPTVRKAQSCDQRPARGWQAGRGPDQAQDSARRTAFRLP